MTGAGEEVVNELQIFILFFLKGFLTKQKNNEKNNIFFL